MEHDGRVTTAAFSADGKTVITGTADASTFGSLDGSVWLWDAATSQLLAKPLENRGGVDRAAPGPDGKTILVPSSDGMARLWNCVSNQPTGKAIEHPDRVYAMAFSPDGKTILSGEYQDGTARLWNATTGQSIGQPMLHEGDVRSVAFSPDGKTVLTGSYDKTARLWDAVTGLPAGQAMEHQGEATPWRSAPTANPSSREAPPKGHAVERRHRPTDRQAYGTSRRCDVRRIQPERQIHTHWLRR